MAVRTTLTLIRREWFLGFSAATCAAFLLTGGQPLGSLAAPATLTVVSLWLFAAMLGSALAAVRHADHLAERLGEPYGTLILTLSITFIEVMSIAAVMLHGANNPTLARDTMFAVIMIVLNGMVGLSLLFGGWRHSEQHYNLQGANAYLGVIIPLSVLSLVLPDFTQTTPGPTLTAAQALLLAVASSGLYATFLAMQTGRHKSYFALTEEAALDAEAPADQAPRAIWPHALLLAAYMIPVITLAEQMAKPIDYLIETLRLPASLGGVIIAVLVATPEALGAVRAASRNHLQRAINIFLGSVLSTIGMTIPAMIVVSYFTHHQIYLGLEHTDMVMLILTLAVSLVTFSSGRTNVIQGAVHLTLFAIYLLLIVQD
jgi:Ca2+:H+ antiporter